MSNLHTLKDHFKESRIYLNRTVTAVATVIILLLVLISRLVYLQIYQHVHYTTMSRNNQVRINPIPPIRGLIFDRKGELLAENIPGFSVELTPKNVPNLQETIAELTKIIDITPSEIQIFNRQKRYKKATESIPLKIKLTEDEVAILAQEKYRLPGVEVAARLIRHYPKGELFAHALGYVGAISEKELKIIDEINYRGTYHIGQNGIEKYYEPVLHGKVGYHHIETDAKGRIVRTLERIPPVSGANLYLSLDSKLQEAAFHALGQERGAVVAIEPATGQILAFVSTPSFDPNLFAQGIPGSSYVELKDSPNRPLFNRALRGLYAPASTVKPFIALYALDKGIVNMSFRIFDPGWFQLNNEGRFYRDWYRPGHGWTDLEKAIQQSCDTYFWQLAIKIGIDGLEEVFTDFGLGSITNIDMSHEAKGLVPSKAWKLQVKKEAWYKGETLNIGIGQGEMLATPLQLANATAIIANHGQRIRPRLVEAQALPGEDKMHLSPVVLPPLTIHKLNWDFVIEAMRKVIHVPGGTAHRISHGLQYNMAGKSGTAQVFSLKQNQKYEAHKLQAHLTDHGWFISFAPLEKPTIALAVLVENNSKAAKDITRLVLDTYLTSVKKPSIPKTEPIIADDLLQKIEEE